MTFTDVAMKISELKLKGSICIRFPVLEYLKCVI